MSYNKAIAFQHVVKDTTEMVQTALFVHQGVICVQVQIIVWLAILVCTCTMVSVTQLAQPAVLLNNLQVSVFLVTLHAKHVQLIPVFVQAAKLMLFYQVENVSQTVHQELMF